MKYRWVLILMLTLMGSRTRLYAQSSPSFTELIGFSGGTVSPSGHPIVGLGLGLGTGKGLIGLEISHVSLGDYGIGVGSATVVTVHGKIVSVNRAKKVVTLEGPNGKRVTVHVYNPYNLAAAKAGEPFVAKFYEIVTIRKLKRGESLPAASLAEGIVSAAPGQTPGAAAGTTVQLSVTVDAIDKNKETVAVKGPDGSVETVKVANPANLKYVKVGDEIVITLSNVVSIWLDKEPGA